MEANGISPEAPHVEVISAYGPQQKLRPAKYIAAAATAIAIAISVIYIFAAMGHTAPQITSTIAPTTSVAATTVATSTIRQTTQMSGAKASAFLSNFSPTVQIPRSQITVYSNSSCNYTQYTLQYLQKGLASPALPTNYSKLNQSLPVFVYFSLSLINSSSVQAYVSKIGQTGGYCILNMQRIADNSTYRHSIVNISGYKAYLMEFSNFTNDGLNLTYTYYAGPRPNLTWYSIVAVSKNVALKSGIWAFSGHANETLLMNYEADLINSFVAKYG